MKNTQEVMRSPITEKIAHAEACGYPPDEMTFLTTIASGEIKRIDFEGICCQQRSRSYVWASERL